MRTGLYVGDRAGASDEFTIPMRGYEISFPPLISATPAVPFQSLRSP